MAFTSPITAVTGATFTASQFNTSVRDNLNALWVGTTAGDIDYYSSATAKTRVGIGAAYSLLKSSGTAPAWSSLSDVTANTPMVAAQAAGDILYASGAAALARLAKPASDTFLKNTSGGVLSWAAIGGTLHASAITTYNPSLQEITSTSYIDVTNAALNIVTTKTCTIIMIATGRFGIDNSSRIIYARPMIASDAPASDDGSAQESLQSLGIYPYTVLHKKTGVAAGTTTCKIQGKISGSSAIGYFGAGTILLFAIEE